MHRLAQLDVSHVWHPFTQMRDWLKHEPIVIVAGEGARLWDAHGREYLDGNSSIWTNLHGHNHPRLNDALRRQLGRIAHSSALGLANEPASVLAAELAGVVERSASAAHPAGKDLQPLRPALLKVFFSDDGSTALEVALKLNYEFARRTGLSPSPRFLALAGAYHGDTIGAVSLGHIDLFHRAYRGLLFRSDRVMAPYCYRCPFNRAKPARADARACRQCKWECVREVERRCERQRRKGHPYAGFVVEPRLQGAAGMIPQPDGWLSRVTSVARAAGTLIIADEVMTGFGRTGGGAVSESRPTSPDILFAAHAEGVQPDFLCLAKGLTGGYLPMAATLTTQNVFDAFLGEYDEFRTFFHGHSYTGNQLGAATALASLQLLNTAASRHARLVLERTLAEELDSLWSLEHVGDVRRVGLIAGIELVRDWRTRAGFELRERAGIRVCEAMARRGVLTRPIGNVVVLMPPYCTTARQARRLVAALREAIEEVLP